MKIHKFIGALSFMLMCFGSSVVVYSQPAEDLSQEEMKMNFLENPCPQPRQALSETPNDLQVIQEDITRFNLCLQRAQLLSRLNDLAKENSNTINSSLNEKLQNIAGDFQPMPLPQVSIPEIPEFYDRQTAPIDPIPEPSQIIPSVAQPPKELESWFITSIKGQNGVLVATLIDNDGNITHVKSGEIIPETKVKIMSISQISVHVLEDKKSTKLKWKQ